MAETANVKPYQNEGSKKEQVESMFNRIAGTYDVMNRVLSAGIDKSWRKKAIALLKEKKPQLILDVATGTADFAIQALELHPQKITGIDISENMLDVGREKIKNKKKESQIELIQADSENMPFQDSHFDAVTVAFGVRNFENLPKGLSEIFRVLKPNGTAVILEFSKPTAFPIKQLYAFYFWAILPLIGKIFSADAHAYTYLPRSVEAFPEGKKFTDIFENIGFKNVRCYRLTFGIASIYAGTK